MKKEHRLEAAVRHELEWEPFLDHTRIQANVADGIVFLSGEVPSIVERNRAENAAARVPDVRGVADELAVDAAASEHRTVRLARAALNALSRSIPLPTERIKVVVRDRLLKLIGEVDADYQRQAAIMAVTSVPGVKEVLSMLVVRPRDGAGADRKVR